MAITATVRNISSTETEATVGSKNCSTWARIWIGRVLMPGPGEEERDRHVVERGDEGKDEGRDHPCPHIRQHDGEEGLQPAALPKLIAASSMEKSKEARLALITRTT